MQILILYFMIFTKNKSTIKNIGYWNIVAAAHRGHMACLPPSTGKEIPVENEASSEAKNAIAFATSSGLPGRPRACVSLLLSKN